MTRAELADKVGVSDVSVFNWETAVFKPTHEHLEKIADACGVSMQRFWGKVPKRRAA
jgi:transcriptional regulator with XRE-family HTH domain